MLQNVKRVGKPDYAQTNYAFFSKQRSALQISEINGLDQIPPLGMASIPTLRRGVLHIHVATLNVIMTLIFLPPHLVLLASCVAG